MYEIDTCVPTVTTRCATTGLRASPKSEVKARYLVAIAMQNINNCMKWKWPGNKSAYNLPSLIRYLNPRANAAE